MSYFFFFNDPAPTEIYTLSLHDALPISADDRLLAVAGTGDQDVARLPRDCERNLDAPRDSARTGRSEEHTSELQSRFDLVCRLLLEKKKNNRQRSVLIYINPITSCSCSR